MRAELLSRLYTRRLEILRIRARARAWKGTGREPAQAGLRAERGLRDHAEGNLFPEVLRAEAFRNALALGT